MNFFTTDPNLKKKNIFWAGEVAGGSISEFF